MVATLNLDVIFARDNMCRPHGYTQPQNDTVEVWQV
jgi:hypothetical protein